ncbi:calcineurin-binding protein cabin-1-like isoform X3 [Macrotis lagotis]|uniref:calcineurin-binding protein cabin-1-like isoform X3 n=1 Tax=Macrotis lagotis TaxID=92651 RepID=UPI003D68D6FA
MARTTLEEGHPVHKEAKFSCDTLTLSLMLGEEPAASSRRGTSGPQQQEAHPGPQVDLAMAATQDPELGHTETVTSAISGRTCGQASSSKPSGSLAPRTEPPRVKARLLPTMPKLVIPSSISKFPPEITVTPPTPTLLSPKGSISEETKQKLKSAILSAQSAATVKKESLCQPALEILEMSSQESSLESESDEDDDYMDI